MRGPFRPEFKEDAHTENVAYTMLFWHANLVRKKWQQKSSTIHSTGFPKTGLLNKSQTTEPNQPAKSFDAKARPLDGDEQRLAVGTGGRTNAVTTAFRRGRSGSAEFEAMAPELPDASLAAAGRRLKGLMLVASRRGSVATLSGACDHGLPVRIRHDDAL
jgi:hypothetical protein